MADVLVTHHEGGGMQAEILRARCGETVMGDGGFIPLVVVARCDIVGDAACQVIATQDGRRAILEEWHCGPAGDAVYFETFGVLGVRSHGWIDAVSRKVVQTG